MTAETKVYWHSLCF